MRRLLFLVIAVAGLLAACAPQLVPADHASAAPQAYTLDSGDRLRVIVFGQEALSGSYAVDPSGHVAMPLIGQVPARGLTAAQFGASVSQRLQGGFIRNPDVSVEIEAFRPFFILGEVRNPGQYPFVAGLTAEIAVAIAGGYTARAQTQALDVTRVVNGQTVRGQLRPGDPVYPGDTLTVRVRFF